MPPPPAELFASRVFLGPALRAQPDRRLVDLVRDGYDAAFEEIVRRYRKQLDRFAAGIVGGRAEDVTQDAFSKALLALRGSKAEIELRPWLYRIVRNTALNDLRDRAPAAEELSELLPGGRSAAAEAEAREELRDLMERLGALPEPQRAALVMRELEGLSHEEIAAALGVSGGAARQAIYRARAALREGLGFLVPLPVFRMLAANGAEMVKAGAATVLIAGTVGAGVAIQHHGHKSGPEAAEAAPLAAGKHGSAETSGTSAQSSSSTGSDDHGGGRGRSRDDAGGHGSDDRSGSLDTGTRSGPGPSRGGSHSDEGSSGSGDDGSHHSGSSGSGSDDSGSGDRYGGSSGGSGSDDGGPSGDSGSDNSPTSGDSGSSGSGSGEVETEPTSEPTLSESSGDSGGSSGDSESSSDISGSGSSGSDDSLSTSSGTTDGSS